MWGLHVVQHGPVQACSWHVMGWISLHKNDLSMPITLGQDVATRSHVSLIASSAAQMLLSSENVRMTVFTGFLFLSVQQCCQLVNCKVDYCLGIIVVLIPCAMFNNEHWNRLCSVDTFSNMRHVPKTCSQKPYSIPKGPEFGLSWACDAHTLYQMLNVLTATETPAIV